VSLAKELRDEQCSLRQISALLAEQGYVTAGGKPYVASAVQAGERLDDQREAVGSSWRR